LSENKKLSKKLNLFDKDGFLKPCFISKNYKSSIGWDCLQFCKYGPMNGTSYKGKMLSTSGKNDLLFQYQDGSSSSTPISNIYDDYKIKQFSKLTIPKYELCWFKVYNCEGDYWAQGRFEDYEEDTKKFLSIDNTQIDLVTGKHNYNCFDLCVPTLIAENTKKAQWIIDNTDWMDL